MRTKTAVGMVAMALSALLVPAGAAPAGGEGAGSPRPQCHDPIPAAPRPPGVTVTLDLSSTDLERGDPLRMEVTVRNEGVLPVPYRHGGQTHDFWIRDERGAIWLWSQGGTFTSILVNAYLQPGETKSAHTTWRRLCRPDGRGLRRGLPGPGRYVAQALWVSDAGDEDAAWWSEEVPFRIRRPDGR